jgi:hypothetical protein
MSFRTAGGHPAFLEPVKERPMKIDRKLEPDEKSGSPTKDVTFIVTLILKPGCEAEFLDLLTPVLDAMRHESTFVNAVLHHRPPKTQPGS